MTKLLQEKLANAEETLRAITSGEVDTFVVAGKNGPQIFTLEGAERAYRVLIESMNEGALTLSAASVILYANQCFAKMLKRPLNKILGFPLSQFLPDFNHKSLQQMLNHKPKKGGKLQTLLLTGAKSKIPVQISFRVLGNQLDKKAAHSMVVTDITEAKQNEEMLRALNHRVNQIQETERRHIAIELHDGITQNLCAILFRSQALIKALQQITKSPPFMNSDVQSAQTAAQQLEKMTVNTISEVEGLSKHLRPSVLEDLGLVFAIRDLIKEFMLRTKIAVKVQSNPLLKRVSHEAELALYRILQESLRNIEKHAKAKKVVVKLSLKDSHIHMKIKDNGIGLYLDAKQLPRLARSKKSKPVKSKKTAKGGLGLLSMRERSTQLGGTLKITSVPKQGTLIEVSIPL